MGGKEFNVESYHISHRTGCMIEDPLSALPDYFEPWNRLSKSISDLVKDKRVREEVHKIPLLDHTKLEGYRQRRLAHLQLSFITAGYVWQGGDEGVSKVLPRCVAVPFYHISKELGVHPILCHMDVVLANFRLIDPYGPDELSNLDVWYCLPGGDQGKWFVTVTVQTELEFAKCLKPLEKTLNLIEDSKCNKEDVWQYYVMQDITGHLNDICQCIYDMKTAVSHMHDQLTAVTFFNVLRPFLGGWGGEGNILPEGLVYEGISDKPMKLAGGSAAQSTSLQALDALFGIRHTDDKKEFLLKMRESMPPDHVRFIEDLESRSQLSSYVKEMDVLSLTQAFNKCIKALTDFRSYHIGIVAKYVISAAKAENEGKFKSLDEKGTGGTDLIPFLKDILHDTQNKQVTESKEGTEMEKQCGSMNNSQQGFSLGWMLGLSVLGLFIFAIGRKTIT